MNKLNSIFNNFNFKLSKIHFQTVLLTLLFRLSLDFLYVFYVNPEFDYNGFLLEYNHFKNVLSLLLLILFSLLLPLKTKTVSHITLQALFILLYIPIGTFWVFTDGSSEWFFLCSLFWLILTILLRSKFEFNEIPSLKGFSDKKYFFITLTVCILGLIVIGANAKWTFNLNFFAVYEIRASNPMEKVPFSGYLVGWINVLLKFILIYSIVKFLPRFNPLVLLSILVFILLFSVSGHKSIFFTPILLVGTYMLLRTKKFYQNFLIFILFIFALGYFIYFFFDDGKVLTMIVRRVFLVPAQLSFYYHDFFQNNPIYLSNSIMSEFIQYPYDRPIPYVIAKEYFDKENMSSNNGIISDGYMHFGVLGIVLWSLFFGLLIKFCDMLVRNKPILIFLPLFLIGTRIFVNGALLTTIFTHGFWLLMLLSYLYPVSKNEK